MATIDLNAARAARREQSGDALLVKLNDLEFHLPPELPIAVAEALAELAGRETNEDATPEDLAIALGAMGSLFPSTEDWDAFRRAGSLEDLMFFMEGVFDHYGVSLGKLQASGSSSTGTGRNSRRAGRSTTGATSGKTSTARKRAASGGSSST